jgi:hypothetical protein
LEATFGVTAFCTGVADAVEAVALARAFFFATADFFAGDAVDLSEVVVAAPALANPMTEASAEHAIREQIIREKDLDIITLVSEDFKPTSPGSSRTPYFPPLAAPRSILCKGFLRI